MAVQRTVLQDGQPPNVAFTVLARLCGSKTNEMEPGIAHSPKMVREGTLAFFFE